MAKLIDADALKENLTTEGCDYDGAEYFAYLSGIERIKDEIDEAPEIDPVHAAGGVYCRECKYFDDYSRTVSFNRECMYTDQPRSKNDFCSRGVKREVEENG